MKPRWIISKPVDLTLVIGSSLAGFLFLGLNLLLQVPFSWLWWIWSVGFDGTHIFGTVSRTYLDRDERARNGVLLYGSLAVFFSVGPILVLMGLKLVLAIFVGVWAYYHVVRQHYGFVMLYKAKNRDMEPAGNRRDTWFVYVMLTAPAFLRFFVRSPEELGLPANIALNRVIPGFEAGYLACIAALFVYYVWHVIQAGNYNWPKLMLLGGIVPLHWLTFGTMSWQAAVPTVTIVHNLQYHAIVWFHNRNKYLLADTESKFGKMPVAVAKSLALYIGVGLVFSLLYRVPGFYAGKVSDLAFGLFCGFGFTHYYLDSKIWRVRGDQTLRQTLRLAESA